MLRKHLGGHKFHNNEEMDIAVRDNSCMNLVSAALRWGRRVSVLGDFSDK